MRPGRRLAVDVGDVRIGIAVSDPDAILATPVRTLSAGPEAVARVAELAAAHEVVEIVVGLPVHLSGRSGRAADKARAFAVAVKEAVEPIGVRLVDERLSTVQAESTLRTSRRKGAARRAVIDQAAAVVILQAALDTERSSGTAPGEVV